ncbi:unnamed protein product [Bursaphelenchus okinawaensis]|uniref:Uncharacterized protein n=1 Tax=Bursaphelenchus okinawaensis TaxID=465554 RepID=A0A811JTI6_9BILA|nr:unnamed protein product [Bursaphelenchus okinawaensis]CAG9083076.1 unnamed protein product [Bursaphelenchus okinawaensis]
MSSKPNSKGSKHPSTSTRDSTRHVSSSSQRLSRRSKSNRVKSQSDGTHTGTRSMSRLRLQKTSYLLQVYKSSTYEDLAIQCENIIDDAHEHIERLFLVTSLRNFSVDNDEKISLDYADFSNCSSREMTPPTSPKTHQQTRTPFSTPTPSIREGPHTPTSDFETLKHDGNITTPPNTPNFDLFLAELRKECESSPVHRERSAKAAAMCLLKGLGLFGQKIPHRSPAQSLRLKRALREKILEENHSTEQIVPLKRESLVSFPKAYRVQQGMSVTKCDTSKERSKVKSNATLSVTELEDGMQISLKLTLNVGEYSTKPVHLVFKCSGADNRPVDLTLNGVSGWNDKQGPLASKDN